MAVDVQVGGGEGSCAPVVAQLPDRQEVTGA
jgi:hypothetical protein